MKHTISNLGGVGCSLLVLREGWEAQCYYVGWGERILRSEGWKVVLIVNANGEWSFYSIIQIIFIYFSTDFLCVKLLALGRGVPSFFLMQMKNCHLNTGIKLLLKISRSRSSTVELCVWLLSRLVHYQLLHLSLFVYSI